jgi:hypothetical protein
VNRSKASSSRSSVSSRSTNRSRRGN